MRKSKQKPKIRRVWLRNPKTKIKEDARIYSRPKIKKELREITDEEGNN